MATVKTQGGKVITKNGKVSCTCCEEPQCCMYPAQALADGLYSADDLPDAIEWLEGSGNPTIYDKLNPPESSAFGLAYYLAQGSAPIGSGDEDVVVLRSDVDPANWERNSGGLIGGPGLCLINAYNENPPGDTFEDQFADTYTISGPLSGTVTRESICVWRGESLTLSNYGYQWKINGNTKSGNQNTPVGSYAGGFTVS